VGQEQSSLLTVDFHEEALLSGLQSKHSLTFAPPHAPHLSLPRPFIAVGLTAQALLLAAEDGTCTAFDRAQHSTLRPLTNSCGSSEHVRPSCRRCAEVGVDDETTGQQKWGAICNPTTEQA
jgi:hypothetical protein